MTIDVTRGSVHAVRGVLADVMGPERLREVHDDDLLFEQRIIDSLSLVEFLERLEWTFGIELDGPDLTPANFASLVSIAQLVTAKRPP
jgi:acyl carrier protein